MKFLFHLYFFHDRFLKECKEFIIGKKSAIAVRREEESNEVKKSVSHTKNLKVGNSDPKSEANIIHRVPHKHPSYLTILHQFDQPVHDSVNHVDLNVESDNKSVKYQFFFNLLKDNLCFLLNLINIFLCRLIFRTSHLHV